MKRRKKLGGHIGGLVLENAELVSRKEPWDGDDRALRDTEGHKEQRRLIGWLWGSRVIGKRRRCTEIRSEGS